MQDFIFLSNGDGVMNRRKRRECLNEYSFICNVRSKTADKHTCTRLVTRP